MIVQWKPYTLATSQRVGQSEFIYAVARSTWGYTKADANSLHRAIDEWLAASDIRYQKPNRYDYAFASESDRAMFILRWVSG